MLPTAKCQSHGEEVRLEWDPWLIAIWQKTAARRNWGTKPRTEEDKEWMKKEFKS